MGSEKGYSRKSAGERDGERDKNQLQTFYNRVKLYKTERGTKRDIRINVYTMNRI